MDKTFNPHVIEQHWYQAWESQGLFSASDLSTMDSTGAGASPFAIMIPPPNVTGHLHMGHAFQTTLMDTLIRFKRMQGCPTLWQMGTDHAGIATQMVVERQLVQQNKTRQEIGRESFVDAVWQWKARSGDTISQQLRRMGASLDWARERFTMDQGFSKAVIKVFVTLYDEGLIYRGKRLVNWDAELKTAISDLEVITQEEPGFLWHFRYPIKGSDQSVEIATTRPETLLGDMAVAVHPEDVRYQHLIGAKVCLPLTDREIPIIADEYVDPEFGTGCVKITPAHDFNDFEVAQRHGLPCLNILEKNAVLNDQVPTAYQHLDRFEARKAVVKALQVLGLVVKIEDYRHPVPRGDRSGSIIEPYLTEQWYVKAKPLAEPAIAAVEQGHIQFVPSSWQNTYFAWMRDIQDWCISRQLWWGHRIPAWYDQNNQIFVGESEAEVRAKYQISADTILLQDEDVLDTWFSSALWTFGTLDWPDVPNHLRGYHPTSVLVTGFDIIFFWVARMIMMTLKFTNEIPFHKVYVHGLVRDAEGQKMSKSKGNVLDPIDIIDGIGLEQLTVKRTQNLMQSHLAQKVALQTKKQFPNGIAAYGTDALRFTFLSLASTGRDIKFDIGRLEGYRNFCNKLWNAARFVMMHVKDLRFSQPLVVTSLAHPIDQWIWQRFDEVRDNIEQQLAQYRFDLASQALYDFVWEDFCDWYLELCKPRLFQAEGANQNDGYALKQTLMTMLEHILRLAHPFLPFITEEIWQQLKQPLNIQTDFILTAAYPEKYNLVFDKTSVEWLKNLITKIRILRSEVDLSPGKKVSIVLRGGNADDRKWAMCFDQEIRQLAKVEQLEWQASDQPLTHALTQWLQELEVALPIEGLLDIPVELAKLEKQRHEVDQEIQRLVNKLNNPNFAAKAPKDVVLKEQQKQQDYEALREKLNLRIEMLNAASA